MQRGLLGGQISVLSTMGFFICLPNCLLAGPCRENYEEFRWKVEPSFHAEFILPEGRGISQPPTLQS